MKINAWTQWGELKTVVVGIADFACFQLEEIGFKDKINNSIATADEISRPIEPKKQRAIYVTSKQLNNLAYILNDLGIKFLRPVSLNFDIFFQKFFTTLSTENELVILSQKYRKRLYALLRFISEHKVITKARASYSVLVQLIAFVIINKIYLHSLKKVISVSKALMQQYKFYNLHCTPENEVISIFKLKASDTYKTGSISIGKSTVDNKVFIDEYHNSMQEGQYPLYVASNLLCHGYLNRSETIAKDIIKNPFQTKEKKQKETPNNNGKNSILYRTGDLAHYLPDSNIEFFDDQIKIRSYRIGLDEIESTLSTQSSAGCCDCKRRMIGNEY